MLKIKDDVDLKELEKFGFKPRYNELTGKINKYVYIYKNESLAIEIRKTNDSNYIEYWEVDLKCISRGLEALYDLIQAGLVEKV